MNDLMDMQDPTGMPSFLDMAQASRPQMMGNAPSVVAGGMYGQDMRRHDEFLQKAAMLAQIKAKLQGQHADEMGAAAPGRMDKIMVDNALNRQDRNDIGTLTDNRAFKNSQDGEDRRTKAREAAMKEFGPYADAWGSENADKPSIRQAIRDADIRWGKSHTSDIPDDKLDAIMNMVSEARKNDPAMRKAQIAADAKTDSASILSANRLTIQGMKDKLAVALARYKAENKASTEDPVKAIQRKWSKGEQLTPSEEGVLNWNAMLKTYGPEAGVAKTPGKLTLDSKGGITESKPVAPPRPTVDAAMGKTPPIPKIGDVRDGYKFKGGNPGVPANWEKVQ